MARTTRPISSPAAPLRAADQDAALVDDQELTPAELLRRYWWVSLLGGVAAALAGIFVLANPGRTLALVSIALGVYLIFWGAMQLLGGLESLGERGGPLRAVLGALGIAAGVLVVTRPIRGVTVIGLVFGTYLLVSAAVAFVAAMSSGVGRSLDALRGTGDLVAGIVVVVWPGIGLLTLAAILGIYLVARGVLDVSGSLAVRRGG
ncbi:MAG TPA: DUF308 domain-containing protein [Acidimicrobiales bacterium]|nr:DUF308 domain-containing protein [Acidimicrobiales bacterium]